MGGKSMDKLKMILKDNTFIRHTFFIVFNAILLLSLIHISVCLAVKLPSAFTLFVRFPSALREPLGASVTL